MYALTSRQAGSFVVAVAAGLLAANSASAAGIAKFENFPEGLIAFGPFTDPLSGITFSNPASANQNFTSEFGDFAPARPLTSPGNFLSSNGWAPGGGIALPYQFGFDAHLPEASGLVQMELIYALGSSGGNTVTVTGLNSAGATVASTSYHATSGFFVETTMTLSSPSNDISAIHVVANDIFDGFDNIRFSPVPEPASAGAAGVIGVGAFVRRRRRTW
jgi:MYXO-CTERM domain-containing protein